MTFAELIAAAEKGAASIYHAVLATGAEVESWAESPLVAPMIGLGVSAANEMLSRAGVPLGKAAVVESDVATALKQIAAADPTVPSGGAIGALARSAGDIASHIAPNQKGRIDATVEEIEISERLGVAMLPTQPVAGAALSGPATPTAFAEATPQPQAQPQAQAQAQPAAQPQPDADAAADGLDTPREKAQPGA